MCVCAEKLSVRNITAADSGEAAAAAAAAAAQTGLC